MSTTGFGYQLRIVWCGSSTNQVRGMSREIQFQARSRPAVTSPQPGQRTDLSRLGTADPAVLDPCHLPLTAPLPPQASAQALLSRLSFRRICQRRTGRGRF